MAGTAVKTDPVLWDRVKAQVTAGDRGGKPGQWSARKAQLAVQVYKKQGGGFLGPKTSDNHLRQWTREAWGTRSGRKSGETGERYLPKRARARLTDQEYAETTAKKRQDTKRGKQFSAQPASVARKTAPYRAGQRGEGRHAREHIGDGQADLMSMKRTELMERAARAGIAGRSRMSKAELVKALG
jgi:hypothetical protein